MVLSIPRCAARFGWPCLIFTPATRSHLSLRQGMSANAVRGDTCRAQAMQFSAQRGKWCAIGPGIHARGTAGMPVGCSARGQAQWKAAGDTRGPTGASGLRGLITETVYSHRPDSGGVPYFKSFFFVRVLKAEATPFLRATNAHRLRMAGPTAEVDSNSCYEATQPLAKLHSSTSQRP